MVKGLVKAATFSAAYNTTQLLYNYFFRATIATNKTTVQFD